MNRLFYKVLFALTTISTFWACSDEDPWSPYQSNATLSHTQKGWDETTIAIKACQVNFPFMNTQKPRATQITSVQTIVVELATDVC